MATSGAYAGQSFSFNYSFVDSSTPESFFATDLATSDVTVYNRNGSTTSAGAAIASAPTRAGSIFTFTLSSSEMVNDEVILEVSATGMIPEIISIVLEPTPADISEVNKTSVTGVSDFKADTTGLSTFDPTTDTVANVTTVATCTTNSDMRGTDSAYTGTPPTAAAIADSVWDEAQSGHTTVGSMGYYLDSQVSAAGGGSAPTEADIYTYFTSSSRQDTFKATGFSTFNPASDTVANVTTVGSVSGSVGSVSAAVTTDAASRTASQADVSSLATQASVNTIDSNVDAILVDTNDLQTNQGNWLTATGFSTHSAADVVSAMQVVAGDFKADVSGLSTFDSTTDSVTVGTNNDKTGYVLTQTFPSNFSTLIIGTGADAGKVTTSNPAAGSGSAHTAQDVANLILVTPANKLATDASGNVEANNMRGTDSAATSAQVSALNDFDPATDTVANVTTVGSVTSAVTTDAASRTASQADVSSLATQASVNTVDTVVDAIKVKTDQLNFTVANQVDANALTGGGGGTAPTEAEIYTYFTDGTRENVFKADVSGLATQSSVDSIDTDVQNIGSDVSAILTDTNDLQTNQNNWLTATGFSTFDPATDEVTTDAASRNASKADVSGLSTFNPATDTVANVTTVGSVSGAVTTDTASREASKADVSSLASQASVDVIDGNVDTLVAGAGSVTLTTAQIEAIADEVLSRSVSNVEAGAAEHTLATIVLSILESQRTATNWTIYRTNGITPHATKVLTLDGTAQPVTRVQ